MGNKGQTNISKHQRDDVLKLTSHFAVMYGLKENDQWFLCQGLARAAAETNDEKLLDALLKESFKAANLSGDRNRIVSVSAWPLRVLLRSGKTKEYEEKLNQLLALISEEPNAKKRQDALCTLISYIDEMPNLDIFRIEKIFEAAVPDWKGWRTAQSLRFMASVMDDLDHAKAIELAFMIKNLRNRRRTLRLIGERELAETQY